MKILYINSQKADYLQDIAFNGLCKTIGSKNVIDWPWNSKFHFKMKEYPKNFGYVPGTAFSSLLSKVRRKNYDCAIVSSTNIKNFENYKKIINTIPSHIPIGFIDGGDRPEIAGDLERYGAPELFQEVSSIRPFDFIFKREMLKTQTYPENIYPLPFGYNFDHVQNIPYSLKDKKYNVTFWATESHPIREQALDLIQDQFDCRQNGSVRGINFKKFPYKGDKYLLALAQSRISLNFRGGGWDTMRYWEVPAVKSFMISQEIKIKIPNDFVHKESVVFCKDDLSDLLELCQYYLDHPKEREEIALHGHDHLKKYHSAFARGKYINSIIERYL